MHKRIRTQLGSNFTFNDWGFPKFSFSCIGFAAFD